MTLCTIQLSDIFYDTFCHHSIIRPSVTPNKSSCSFICYILSSLVVRIAIFHFSYNSSYMKGLCSSFITRSGRSGHIPIGVYHPPLRKMLWFCEPHFRWHYRLPPPPMCSRAVVGLWRSKVAPPTHPRASTCYTAPHGLATARILIGDEWRQLG